MGIFAAVHPWHRRQLWPSREGAVGDFLSGALRRIRGGNIGARGRSPSSETGGTGPSRPNTDGT